MFHVPFNRSALAYPTVQKNVTAAHNFAVMRHFALNLIRLDPVKRNGGLKVRRLIAATSDTYRAQLLGLV
jgi:hypothetical protein